MNVPISSLQAEGQYQASQWQGIPVLLSLEEMEELFKHLPTFAIYQVSQVVQEGGECLEMRDFLEIYKRYLSSLLEENGSTQTQFRAPFSTVWSTTPDSLYIHPLSGSQRLVKVRQPVVQLQPHTWEYSRVDQQIRSKTFGPQAISWGIQFSYPALFQDPHTGEIVRIQQKKEQFPNTTFFHSFRRWIRQTTVPTAFLIEGKRIQTPIRTGKECLKWISKHRGLIERKWSIDDN